MATIDDLDWKPHPAGIGGERAVVKFPNGYGASVVRGGMFYTDGGTYELGVLGPDGHLTYETPITGDVLGYQTAEEINDVLARIEALPADMPQPIVIDPAS